MCHNSSKGSLSEVMDWNSWWVCVLVALHASGRKKGCGHHSQRKKLLCVLMGIFGRKVLSSFVTGSSLNFCFVQVILRLLRSDLFLTMRACTEGQLHCAMPEWHCDRSAAAVVLASQGYPGSYPKGKVISGVDKASALAGVEVSFFAPCSVLLV